MMGRVLVIGGDGLLGSHLVRRLLAKGHAVRVLVQPASSSPTLEDLPVEAVAGDLLDDSAPLGEAMLGCQAVFHVAAITDIWADPQRVWKVNLEGTRRVVEACLARKVERLVFVGSASSFQFGPLECPGDEAGGFPDDYRGIPYMESKYAAMQLVLDAARRRGLPGVVVAPTFLLGDYDWRPSSGELVRQYLARNPPVVPPGGRNFVHAGDVAEAMVAALERGRAGECYIAGGHNLSYREFFGQVAQAAGVAGPRWTLPPRLVRAAGRGGSIIGTLTGRRIPIDDTMARLMLLGSYYSSEKARRDLGMPCTPIRTAIEDTLTSLRSYGHLPMPGREAFAGKVALVSGASRGVGLATARALLERGASVVIAARGARRLEDSRRRLERIGGQVVAVAGDVSRWEDAQRMVGAATDRFGRLDILINNAGVSMRGRFPDLAPEVCEQTIATNLLGAVYLTRAAAGPILAARGSIVFVSSIAGLIGLPGASTYCAAKSALTGLSESLRLELGPAGVHVGVVYLGFTEHDPEKRVLSADGTPVPPDRPAHHSQAFAAREILKLVESRARQRIMTPIGTVGWLAHRLSPWMVESLIARAQAGEWGLFRKFS